MFALYTHNQQDQGTVPSYTNSETSALKMEMKGTFMILHEPFDELKKETHIDGKLCFRGQVGPEERYLDVSGPVTMFSDVSVYGHQFFPAVKVSILSIKKDFLETKEIMGRL